MEEIQRNYRPISKIANTKIFRTKNGDPYWVVLDSISDKAKEMVDEMIAHSGFKEVARGPLIEIWIGFSHRDHFLGRDFRGLDGEGI